MRGGGHLRGAVMLSRGGEKISVGQPCKEGARNKVPRPPTPLHPSPSARVSHLTCSQGSPVGRRAQERESGSGRTDGSYEAQARRRGWVLASKKQDIWLPYSPPRTPTVDLHFLQNKAQFSLEFKALSTQVPTSLPHGKATGTSHILSAQQLYKVSLSVMNIL